MAWRAAASREPKAACSALSALVSSPSRAWRAALLPVGPGVSASATAWSCWPLASSRRMVASTVTKARRSAEAGAKEAAGPGGRAPAPASAVAAARSLVATARAASASARNAWPVPRAMRASLSSPSAWKASTRTWARWATGPYPCSVAFTTLARSVPRSPSITTAMTATTTVATTSPRLNSRPGPPLQVDLQRDQGDEGHGRARHHEGHVGGRPWRHLPGG